MELSQDKYYKYKIVRLCFSVVINPIFDAFILFVIILNTICLSLDQEPVLDEWVVDIIAILNFVFTFIFTFEAAVKITGLGFREFLKEKMNQFDLVIVLISIGEMQFGSSEKNSVFSSFRAFRLFKIFRLFKVGDLRILIDSIMFTITTIGDYVILLALFIYVFSLLGQSYFAGYLWFDEFEKPYHYHPVSGLPFKYDEDGNKINVTIAMSDAKEKPEAHRPR